MSTSHRLPRGSGFGLIEMPDTTTRMPLWTDSTGRLWGADLDHQ